jgi:hypothetical protein
MRKIFSILFSAGLLRLFAAGAGAALCGVDDHRGGQVAADEPVTVDLEPAHATVGTLGQPPHVLAGAAGELSAVGYVNV